jgi:excisionase family DNA binding protein
MIEKLYKVDEVAKLFDVQPATVREWLKSGELRGIKIGGGHYWRVSESAVHELAQERYGDDNANTR